METQSSTVDPKQNSQDESQFSQDIVSIFP